MVALQTSITTLLNMTNFKSLWLGVSGGVDSMVLMHVCAALYHQGKIPIPHIVYIDHQLQTDSAYWGTCVQKSTIDLKLPFHTLKVKCTEHSGIEESARDARYKAIFSMMGECDLLLTAHHYDDQKETVIFRLLRGTGLKGLIGMQPITKLYNYSVGRPFLNMSKSVLVDYANKHNIKAIEDPSNKSLAFSRNAIREALNHINNQKGFHVTQMHIANQLKILEILIQPIMKSCIIEPNILDLAELAKQPSDIREEVFYRFLSKYVTIAHTRMQSLLKQLESADPDKYPSTTIDGFTLVRYRQYASILQLPELYQPVQGSESKISLLNAGHIENKSRKNLSIKPLGSNKGKYKKRLQALGIPCWLRQYIPVINNKLIYDLEEITWKYPQPWAFWLKKGRD